MFSAAQYISMYQRFLGPLAQGQIEINVNNGVGFDSYSVTAYIGRYREKDLVPSSSVRIGDLKIIILASELEKHSILKLGQKDRVAVDGIVYAILNFDDYTRKVGNTLVAVEIAASGGGVL